MAQLDPPDCLHCRILALIYERRDATDHVDFRVIISALADVIRDILTMIPEEMRPAGIVIAAARIAEAIQAVPERAAQVAAVEAAEDMPVVGLRH